MRVRLLCVVLMSACLWVSAPVLRCAVVCRSVHFVSVLRIFLPCYDFTVF